MARAAFRRGHSQQRARARQPQASQAASQPAGTSNSNLNRGAGATSPGGCIIPYTITPPLEPEKNRGEGLGHESYRSRKKGLRTSIYSFYRTVSTGRIKESQPSQPSNSRQVSNHSYIWTSTCLSFVQIVSLLVLAMRCRRICVRGIGMSGSSGDRRSSRPYDRSRGPSSCADRATWLICGLPGPESPAIAQLAAPQTDGSAANDARMLSVRSKDARPLPYGARLADRLGEGR